MLQAHGRSPRAVDQGTLAAGRAAAASAAAEDEEAEREEKLGWVEDTEKYEERWRGGRWREEYLRKRGLPSADARRQRRGRGRPSPEESVRAARWWTSGGDGRDGRRPVRRAAAETRRRRTRFSLRGCGRRAPGLLRPPRSPRAIGLLAVPRGGGERGGARLPPSRPPRRLREAGDGSLYDPRPSCVCVR